MSAGMILGGGIAGLAFALAAAGRAIPVDVLEADPTLHPSGAGLLLAPNALRALARLGLKNNVLADASVIVDGGVTDPHLRPLTQDFFGHYARVTGLPFIGIHRTRLLEILADKVTRVTRGAQYLKLSKHENEIVVDFADGSKRRASWVVLADGIHSRGRDANLGVSPVHECGEWIWRGVTDFPLAFAELRQSFREAWGEWVRFGSIPLGSGQVYWYATLHDRAKRAFAPMDGPEVQHALLQNLAMGFHPIFGAMVAATPPGAVLCNRILDLQPLPSYHTGSLLVIGDAAHATSPHMGQGACQALEDAVALADCLAEGEDAPSAFARFTRIRQSHTQRVVRTSRWEGNMAALPPALIPVRNLMMQRISQKRTIRQMQWLYEGKHS